MLKLIVAIIMFFMPVREEKESATVFYIADTADQLSIMCPLRSVSTQLYTRRVRIDSVKTHRIKTIEKRREEFKAWKQNNMLLFAG
jgi:hypothetical protein